MWICTCLEQCDLFLTHQLFLQNKYRVKHPSFRVKHSRKSTGEFLLLTCVGRPPWDLIRGKVLFCFVFPSLHFSIKSTATSWHPSSFSNFILGVRRHFCITELNTVSYFHIQAAVMFIKNTSAMNELHRARTEVHFSWEVILNDSGFVLNGVIILWYPVGGSYFSWEENMKHSWNV